MKIIMKIKLIQMNDLKPHGKALYEERSQLTIFVHVQ